MRDNNRSGLKLNILLLLVVFLCSGINQTVLAYTPPAKEEPMLNQDIITLPRPKTKSNVSLEQAILKRRSTRHFSKQKISLDQISQLLFAAQGITGHKMQFRTVPSAGALYPLELYILTEEGIFHYDPKPHQLNRVTDQDRRQLLRRAALNQPCVEQAPLDIIICAKTQRTTSKYGQRGLRYVHIESGHCAQNILLEAASLELAVVPIGAFDDEGVIEILQLEPDDSVFYIICVGQFP